MVRIPENKTFQKWLKSIRCAELYSLRDLCSLNFDIDGWLKMAFEAGQKSKTTGTIYLQINKCKECPHLETKRTIGAGYAHDWLCKKACSRLIKGYIEWGSDEPQEVPSWCPLRGK